MNATATKPRTPRKPKTTKETPTMPQQPQHTSSPAALTADQFHAALAEYGDTKRKLEFAEVKYQHRLAIVNTRHKEAIAADTARLNELERQIRDYAETHRTELTGGAGKTAKVGAGCLKWKTKPASVQVDDADTAIAALEKRNLFHCVRIKKEVSKPALMAMRAELEADPVVGIGFADGAEVLSIEI